MSRLLMVSCHSVLEFDELRLFHSLGIDVFSHGAYVDPRDNSGDPKRPPLTELPFHEDLFPLAKATPKEALHPALFDWADVVVFMGAANWIQDNWGELAPRIAKGLRVIWRSIGQSSSYIERILRDLQAGGIELVRYSPTERELPGYAGDGAAMIRFVKDPAELGGWTGEMERIISVGQMVKPRNNYCGLQWFERATEGLPRLMIGPHNADIETMPSALLSYDELIEALRVNRAFFYTGTYPAPYTLGFVEAWIAGIPVVAIGPKLRNHHFGGGLEGYEIPHLIENGVNGYWSDDVGALRRYCEGLLSDRDLAQAIGEQGRAKATALFGTETVAAQWRALLFGDA